MFSLLTFLFRLIFNLFQSKKKLLIKTCIQQKEIEILKRTNRKRRPLINQADRMILAILNYSGDIRHSISIVKPETVIRWQQELIKQFWTYNHSKPVGRPSVSQDIKQLILSMKNDNNYWGCKKIQGELLKLGISLDKKTIRNILDDYRRRGKIKKPLSWRKFISVQANSIYAMDFFTTDTLLNQRFYVFFIIHHKTREIVQFTITQNPTREWVRQQIIAFSECLNKTVYLIHDNAQQFKLDYLQYNIKEICISANAPNMNAIAERFVMSARRESLDFFLLISEKQIRDILTEYINYYNALRPHQGIDQNTPQKYVPQIEGEVRKNPVLGGLCYHYERKAA